MFFINYSSRIVGILFLILFVAYGWFASRIPLDFWSEEETFNARSMPYLIAIVGSLISLLLVTVPQINQVDESFDEYCPGPPHGRLRHGNRTAWFHPGKQPSTPDGLLDHG